ncbi:MAG: hypothetical protein CVT62_04110 [Actinobacteria bacterium HGW-Actinobacteria-2]|nr:MAG: hypothetical protein CVT62_04110 [Actinobacteria bacterium HGW-Actinobacteria-2]
MTKKTGDDLAAQYTDEDWRARYLQLVDIVTLLRHSIIGSSFKIPDRMNSAFTLTEYGSQIQKDLTTKHDVPAKEARMMCLLEIAHDEPMVNLERTHFDVLTDEISASIVKGAMRYPFIYGGYLYRRAAEIFPDRRSRLNSKETAELLEGMPCGVFQVGDLVVGPRGVLRSQANRWVPPTVKVPLQHCGDLTCRRPHWTSLSTDYDAPINQHLPKITKVLTDNLVARGAWTDFTGLLAEEASRPFDDLAMVGIPVSLGDCLTDEELALVASQLSIEVPELDSAELRANLLQEIWTKTDDDIARSVDFLITAGSISLAPHEVRRPPLVDVAVGSFELRVEIGRHGVRLRPDDPEVPLLRLRRLITHLYDFDNDSDLSELRWQLRTIDGTDVHEMLEEYLRVTSPSDAIGALVLSRRQNVQQAMTELGIESGVSLGELAPASDDVLVVEKLMWKLGFPQSPQASLAAEFWQRQKEARQAVRDANGSAILDLPRLREVLRELFISLEGLLGDTVDFAWWVLATDHLAAARPFTYTPSQGEPAWAALASHANAISAPDKPRFGDRAKRTLYPLGQSFSVLGSLLKSFEDDPKGYLRPTTSIPKWAYQTELKEFPLRHTVPYLDLTELARRSIAAGLAEVSKLLKDGNVHGVRNQVSHFQRSNSNMDDVLKAIQAASSSVEILDTLGFIRAEYRASRTERDAWGRYVIYMRSAAGDEVTFTRPSKVGLVGLPNLHTPQYLVRSAVFSSPREVLRFRVGADSAFSEMWAGFPLPRAKRTGVLQQAMEPASDVVRASYSVLPGN